MNKNLKRNLAVIGLTVLSSAAFSFGALSLNASAEQTAFDTAKIQMIEGASVRCYSSEATEAESGIRFSSVIKAKEYADLEAMETADVKVSYGMLIAPYSYFDDYGEFNAATVFGVDGKKEYTWDGETVEQGASYTKIAHVTYDTLIASTQEGYEDCYEIKGSLIKIREENLTREFVGRGYIKYQVGTEVFYKFADYFGNLVDNNVRSIVYVSQLVIDKNESAAAWVNQHYVSKVTNEETSYTIETYVGDELVKEQEVKTTINADVKDVEPQEYQGYTNVSAETQGKAYANGKLKLKHVYEELDGTEYQVKNGDFETGDLTDWTIAGNIGAVSSETNYWKDDPLDANGFPFGLDGTYMFSAYAPTNVEINKGTLTSSKFTVSQSGWISYKLGGAKNSAYVHVDVVEAATGKILKRYYNQNHKYEEVGKIRLGCELNAYKVNLQDLIGQEVYLRITDFATSDFGLFFLDSVDTLHLAEPRGEYLLANEVEEHEDTIYDLYNGDFSKGMDGWSQSGNVGTINAHETYWKDNIRYENVGNFFSAYEKDGESGDSLEGNKGWLKSEWFEVGGSGWITYRLGGVKNPDQVYMEVIDALSGVKYGHFYNSQIQNCTLINYKADLSIAKGRLVYINFVDTATTDFGLIFCDEFKTHYATVEDVPEYNEAINKVESIYNVMNGGFETGNMLGWTRVEGDEFPGIVTDRDVYWTKAEKTFNKDGLWLFTGVEVEGHPSYEGRIGTFRSNTFILKANSHLKFKMGGGNNEGIINEGIHINLKSSDGTILATYYNSSQDAFEGKMVQYDYEINNAEDIACYIEIVDKATSAWGLICLDSVTITQQ